MEFKHLLRPEVQQFIQDNIHTDLAKVLLAKSPFSDVIIQELAQQIKGKKIAEKKFPFLLKEGIIFPPNLNLEQASSEVTAQYKSALFSGESMIDLTSGFSIDAFFVSQNFKQVCLVERDENLLEIVKHNWLIFNRDKVQYLNLDLNDFLNQNTSKFDLIYLDPARRDTHNRKKFLLEDLSPDITEIQEQLFKFTDKIAVKLSPLMDITMLVQQVLSISEIHIVAVRNEVKELLIIIDKGFQGDVKVVAVNLESSESVFETTLTEIYEAHARYDEADKFLYIPNNAILKSGAFNLISAKYGLKKLHPNTNFYTREELVSDFPGRTLEIETIDAKQIKKGERYNIISKNHPLSPEEIKKKYKIKDGGSQYLIFTQSQKGKVILKSI